MRHMKAPAATPERGITLVEALMVLGIAVAFIAGSLALYNNAIEASRVRDGTNIIYGLIGEVRARFAKNRNYNPVPTLNFSNLGLVPPDAYKSPWGGQIMAMAVSCTGSPPNRVCSRFWVFLTRVPKSACETLYKTFSNSDFIFSVEHGSSNINLTRVNTPGYPLGAYFAVPSPNYRQTGTCDATNIMYMTVG